MLVHCPFLVILSTIFANFYGVMNHLEIVGLALQLENLLASMLDLSMDC